MTIVSWNTQGNAFDQGKLKGLVTKYDPDIICLQECGKLSGTYDIERYSKLGQICCGFCNLGTQYRKKEYRIFYYPWRNECRCTMATLVKAEFDVEKASLIDSEHKSSSSESRNHLDLLSEEGDDLFNENNSDRKGIRAMLQTVIDIGNDCFLSVNNVHLPSGCPKFAMRVAKSYLNKCRNYRAVMIGDMNIPADMWKNETISYRLVAPNKGTHQGGRILDYAFTDIGDASIDVDDDFRNSDHLAIILNL